MQALSWYPSGYSFDLSCFGFSGSIDLHCIFSLFSVYTIHELYGIPYKSVYTEDSICLLFTSLPWHC